MFLVMSAILIIGCSPPPEPTINLYRAIHAGDLDQIKRHLHWGTDINQPGPDGDYPLHVAAKRGYIVIVEALLEYGAKLDVKDGAGHSPLQAALLAGKAQTARILFRHGASDAPQELLVLLVRNGIADRDALALVVNQGADVNARDQGGLRPLHLAVGGGQVLVVKRLITLGAEVNLADDQGHTPLALAKAAGRRDIAALLESYGAQASTETTNP